jgi:hypothetical protein
MLDLKQLFSKYGILYRTSGKNVSANNFVIKCPFCGNDDAGEHLAISDDCASYYCYRNTSHGGRSLYKLLKALKIPTFEYAGKLPTPNQNIIEEIKPDGNDYTQWKYFKQIEENQEAIDYLLSRGFIDPLKVAKVFDLRTETTGRWAARLIVPLTIGWTGRAMRNGIEPRYKAYTNVDGFFRHSYKSSTVVILEGPFDAMRLASVTNQADVIAKCGKRLNPAWLVVYLRNKNYMTVINCPDSDVPKMEQLTETRLINSYVPNAKVYTVGVPIGHKDLCAASETEVRGWFYSLKLN